MNNQDKISKEKAFSRCYDIFANIANRQLESARTAVNNYISESFPKAITINEIVMQSGCYLLNVSLLGGNQQSILYNYHTKEIEML